MKCGRWQLLRSSRQRFPVRDFRTRFSCAPYDLSVDLTRLYSNCRRRAARFADLVGVREPGDEPLYRVHRASAEADCHDGDGRDACDALGGDWHRRRRVGRPARRMEAHHPCSALLCHLYPKTPVAAMLRTSCSITGTDTLLPMSFIHRARVGGRMKLGGKPWMRHASLFVTRR